MTRSLPLAALFLTGCMSNWTSEVPIDTDRDTFLFFFDEDGDGWGAPDSEARVLTTGNVADKYTARNRRDCDDGDPTITGKMGSICPNAAVAVTGTGVVEVMGIISDEGNEFLIFHGVTPKVWASAASAACGETGWGANLGGKLAHFQSVAEANTVTGVLPVGEYLLDIKPGATPSENPSWAADGELSLITTWGKCTDPLPPATMGDTERLVLKVTGTDVCLDFPTDKTAHFVCRRAKPTAEQIALYDEPSPEE